VTESSTLESFEFLQKLGAGSFGSVYKVRRPMDGQVYALKKVDLKALKPKEKLGAINKSGSSPPWRASSSSPTRRPSTTSPRRLAGEGQGAKAAAAAL